MKSVGKQKLTLCCKSSGRGAVGGEKRSCPDDARALELGAWAVRKGYFPAISLLIISLDNGNN